MASMWLDGPRRQVARVALGASLLVLVAGGDARAQADLQLWGTVTLDWLKTERTTYGLDIEPRVLVSAPEGDPAWWSLNLTPSAEHAAKQWLDVVGEIMAGFTQQTDDANSLELTPRVGVRLHLFSRSVPARGRRVRELPPTRRLVVRDLVRVESRNLFYGGTGSGTSSTVRFRNRLEVLAPINKAKLTDDGARYVLADWEWFVPLNEPDERFANRQRIRAGFGWRRDVAWRFEGLYIWTRSRNTIGEGFTTSDNTIDVRVKRVF